MNKDQIEGRIEEVKEAVGVLLQGSRGRAALGLTQGYY